MAPYRCTVACPVSPLKAISGYTLTHASINLFAPLTHFVSFWLRPREKILQNLLAPSREENVCKLNNVNSCWEISLVIEQTPRPPRAAAELLLHFEEKKMPLERVWWVDERRGGNGKGHSQKDDHLSPVSIKPPRCGTVIYAVPIRSSIPYRTPLLLWTTVSKQ